MRRTFGFRLLYYLILNPGGAIFKQAEYGGDMNPYKRLVITVFGLALAVLIFIETQILYTGDEVEVVVLQFSTGDELTIVLREGALAVWRIVGNGLWMLLVAVVGFVWAIPLRRKPNAKAEADTPSRPSPDRNSSVQGCHQRRLLAKGRGGLVFT